jgi:hypothetical protein
MIRVRFVALVSGFVLFLAGYATYIAYLRPAPAFEGVTDPAHVAAVKALVTALPAPAEATLDQYGTWCDAAAAACWTSTSATPRTLIASLSQTLVARGATVRSHECVKPEARPIQAPDGACLAVVDYHGSRLDLIASSRGKSDNGGRTYVRVDSLLVNPIVNGDRSAALGPWASIDLFPAAWTTGVTCIRPVGDDCRAYRQSATVSPVIALPLSQVCDRVRADLRGRFFFGMDENTPAAGSAHAYCRMYAHRYRDLGGKDGEGVFVSATSIDATSTTLTFSATSEL